MLNAKQLQEKTIDTKSVVGWLRLLHNIVQDGLQRPRGQFPENEGAI